MDNTTTNSEAGTTMYEIVPKNEIPKENEIPFGWLIGIHPIGSPVNRVYLRPYVAPAAPSVAGSVEERAKGDKFLAILLENEAAAKTITNEEILEIFPNMNTKEAILELYDDMIAIYRRHLASSPAPVREGMRWVKASERLPDTIRVNWENTHSNYPIQEILSMTDTGLMVNENGAVGEIPYKYLRWLEESPASTERGEHKKPTDLEEAAYQYAQRKVGDLYPPMEDEEIQKWHLVYDTYLDALKASSEQRVDEQLKSLGYDPKAVEERGKVLIKTIKENVEWKEECERLAKLAEYWQKEYYKLNPQQYPGKIDNL